MCTDLMELLILSITYFCDIKTLKMKYKYAENHCFIYS